MYHCLLTQSRYAKLHSVDRDFVETPSMMLEHFFWDAQIVSDVSSHYSYIDSSMRETWLSRQDNKGACPDEPPPRQISLEQAIEMETVQTPARVRDTLSNLFFATYDMLVHCPASREQLEETNLAESFNKLKGEIWGVPGGEALGEGWEYTQGQTVFRAIQGSYDAGYYAYIL